MGGGVKSRKREDACMGFVHVHHFCRATDRLKQRSAGSAPKGFEANLDKNGGQGLGHRKRRKTRCLNFKRQMEEEEGDAHIHELAGAEKGLENHARLMNCPVQEEKRARDWVFLDAERRKADQRSSLLKKKSALTIERNWETGLQLIGRRKMGEGPRFLSCLRTFDRRCLLISLKRARRTRASSSDLGCRRNNEREGKKKVTTKKTTPSEKSENLRGGRT